MGSVVGEKITRLFEFATKENCQLFSFTAGARMPKESVVSLKRNLRLFNVILRKIVLFDGIDRSDNWWLTASFAMEGDIIMAESQALVGFAVGVIKSTVREQLPDGFKKQNF